MILKPADTQDIHAMPIARHLPELDPSEARFVVDLTSDLSEQRSESFAMVYRARRKEASFILILTIIGFFGVAGIHRIFLGKPVSGVLFLVTLGFCGIGTIIDALNFRGLTLDYNSKVALETYRNL